VWTQNPEQKDTDGGRWVLREGANWKSLFDSDDINTDTAPSYEEERMKYLRAKKAATGTAQVDECDTVILHRHVLWLREFAI
jgi:hypothetical protein